MGVVDPRSGVDEPANPIQTVFGKPGREVGATMGRGDLMGGTYNRRRFVAGAAAAGATLLAGRGLVGSAFAAVPAGTVDERLLPGERALRHWTRELDGFGVRPTGSPAHEAYIDLLGQRLEEAGVQDVHRESLQIQRWMVRDAPNAVSLELGSGATARTIPLSSYIPYSGKTGPDGISAPVIALPSTADPSAPPGDVAGKIVVVDIVTPPLTLAPFYAAAYDVYDPNRTMTPATLYERAWVAQLVVLGWENVLKNRGAAGLIAVLDLPASFAKDGYFPYDGNYFDLPGVYVDRDTGAKLRATIAGGAATARIVLDATLGPATTGNLVGTIPGASRETIVLHSHTDGTNCIEDNGGPAVLALSRYFTRLRQADRARTIKVVLTSGHFDGETGAADFVARHEDDLMPDIVAALTLEHLGATEWLDDGSGEFRPTGLPELGGVFVGESPALIRECRALLRRENLERSLVMHAFLTNSSSGPTTVSWPGEGNHFYRSGVPTANWITGPTYLLSGDADVFHKIDFELMYRQVRGFAQMTTNLFTTRADLLRGAEPVERQAHLLGLR